MIAPTVFETNLQLELEPIDAAFDAFRQTYPAFDSTRKLDELRATEYGRLDQQGHVYLDYTGGGLYAESQLRDHMALLSKGIFGNPHSKNLTSMAMTRLVEQARDAVLKYFNASPDEYMVIFTPNSTGALKLIGESYPFGPGDTYLLTFDNHNSVNGIREFARAKGAMVTYVPIVPPDLRTDTHQLAQYLEAAQPEKTTCSPIQPNPISPACSIRLSGSLRRKRKAGTCCWMRPRLRRPIDWISAAGSPTSWIFRFTKCSATRPVRAVCWCVKLRPGNCGVPGMQEARSPSPLCWRATTT